MRHIHTEYKGLLIYFLNIVAFIIIGHFVALTFKQFNEDAWKFVALFYGLWILVSILLLQPRKEWPSYFKPSRFSLWLLIPITFSSSAFYGIFLPSFSKLQLGFLFFANLIICLVNPFLEEIYWRGLAEKYIKNKIIQYLTSTIGFALGHPLIFGVNSPNGFGWLSFAGAFVLGTAWWFAYNKTGSLRGNVLTHFLLDFFGLAGYLLAEKVPAIDLPFK